MQMMESEAVADIEAEISEALERYRGNFDDVPLFSGEKPVIPDWNLDDELKHLTDKSTDDLWRLLGISDNKLVPLADWRDPLLQFSQWLKDDDICPQERKEECNLRWHQLVGLNRLAEAVFSKSCVLNMDEVGVGKTLQIIGLLAYRIMNIEELKQSGRYMGKFSE